MLGQTAQLVAGCHKASAPPFCDPNSRWSRYTNDVNLELPKTVCHPERRYTNIIDTAVHPGGVLKLLSCI